MYPTGHASSLGTVSNISRWVFARNGNSVASLLFAVGRSGRLRHHPRAHRHRPRPDGGRNQIAESYRPGIRLAMAGMAAGVVAFVVPILRYTT